MFVVRCLAVQATRIAVQATSNSSTFLSSTAKNKSFTVVNWRQFALRAAFENPRVFSTTVESDRSQQLVPVHGPATPSEVSTHVHAPESDVKVPVRAYHIGSGIDVSSLWSDTPSRQRISNGDDHCILLVEENPVLYGPGQTRSDLSASSICVAYDFGAVTFFKTDPRLENEWLERCRSMFVKTPSAARYTDDTSLLLRPAMRKMYAQDRDYLIMNSLDLGRVKVISNVLAQSVALDSYNSVIDEQMEKFAVLLQEITDTGVTSRVTSVDLIRFVGSNSLVYNDIVQKLGLLDRHEIAWRKDELYELWEALRGNYELDKRFEAVNRKLWPLQENAKFILSLRSDRKSERAERAIIALISLEIVVNLFTAHGGALRPLVDLFGSVQ